MLAKPSGLGEKQPNSAVYWESMSIFELIINNSLAVQTTIQHFLKAKADTR